MTTELDLSGFELCLMRHGIAEDRPARGSGDAARALTPEGRERMQEIARGLAEAGFVPDWVIASPYLRASETAEIVGATIASAAPVDSCAALEPGGALSKFLTFLGRPSQRRRALAVGHEPVLSEWAAVLTGAGPHADFAFKKGGCCLIAFQEFPPKPPGRLVWWLTPRLLRKLG